MSAPLGCTQEVDGFLRAPLKFKCSNEPMEPLFTRSLLLNPNRWSNNGGMKSKKCGLNSHSSFIIYCLAFIEKSVGLPSVFLHLSPKNRLPSSVDICSHHFSSVVPTKTLLTLLWENLRIASILVSERTL